ncbi:hypothetical protein Peur_026298 [Populus x canadensis]
MVKKLDTEWVSESWGSPPPFAAVETLPPHFSGHWPILPVHHPPCHEFSGSDKPFRFEQMWTKDEGAVHVAGYKMEVKILSQKFIKPSIQTLDHLANMKLSFIDQLAPPVYAPMILHYSALYSEAMIFESDDRFDLLEKSLSEILTCYYASGKIY